MWSSFLARKAPKLQSGGSTREEHVEDLIGPTRLLRMLLNLVRNLNEQ
jgi:hypothetical protein